MPETDQNLTDIFAQENDEQDNTIGITDSEIEKLAETLHSEYEDAIIEQISDLGPADAAELLSKISAEDREKLLSEHIEAFDPYTFGELPPELRKEVLEDMTPVQVASLLSDMDSDDALDIILNLEPAFQQDIIRKLSSRMRFSLEEGLRFAEDSAGRLMQREFIAIPQFWTVGKTLDYLRAAEEELPEYFFDIFVITPTYKLIGVVPLSRLVCSRRSEKLEALMEEDMYPIPADMDQEEVARVFRREDLTSAPVVDESGRLIGVITIDDVVDVIDEEMEEDFLKLAGVGRGDLYKAVFSTAQVRSYWLLVNSVTALMAASVIGLFDTSIEKIVALAILMPIVASMGGNVGMQALAVAVRALATREISRTNARRLIFKEALVGLLNGTVFAAIIGVAAATWFDNIPLGLVVASAMSINLFIAGMSGAGIPILLHKMGADPAVSSSIFLTTITDVVGFFAFLGLATIFLL